MINKKQKIIIGSQYFFYFGVMAIFLPYFNLYCYHIGFSVFEIGMFSSLRTGITIIFPLIWSYIADRFNIRKKIYILCNFISTSIWIFFFYTQDFTLMLLVCFFYTIAYSPIISFMETFSMDMLGDNKKEYGYIRAWGSISFISVVTILGTLMEFYSVTIILALIFAGSLAQAIIGCGISEKHSSNTANLQKISLMNKFKKLLTPKMIIFLLCGFLMLVSHGTYYGFFSIYLEELGYGSFFIGIAWAIASVAEIVIMLRSDYIFKYFKIDTLLFISFLIAALRWLILYFGKSSYSIIASQILHAITYGVFHMTCILYVDQLTSIENKTLGQAINNAVTYGLGMMVGFLINGYFYEQAKELLFIFSSLTALIGGIIIMVESKIYFWKKSFNPS